jgi:hypothetical protein
MKISNQRMSLHVGRRESRGESPQAWRGALGVASIACFVAVLAGPGTAQLSGCNTFIASVDNSGAQGSGSSAWVSISSNGRYVAFITSNALAFPDSNTQIDVYVRDTVSGSTTLVSKNNTTPANGGNGESRVPSISADGTKIAFQSPASDLVANDGNNNFDVFLFDSTASPNIQLVSPPSQSGWTPGDCGGAMAMSKDGLYIAYITNRQIDSADTNAALDVFVWDRSSGTTTRITNSASTDIYGSTISISSRRTAYGGGTSLPVVVYSKTDSSGIVQVYAYDMQSTATTLVSQDSTGTAGNATSTLPSISPDGEFVAFVSLATNLQTVPTPGQAYLYVRDLLASGSAGQCLLGPTTFGGNSLTFGNFALSSISTGGRIVVVPAFTNPSSVDTQQVYLWDRMTGVLDLVSVDTSGSPGNHRSLVPVVSDPCAGAISVAFVSAATTLTAFDANGSAYDVFVRACSSLTNMVGYCFGTTAACPCGNGGSGGGCGNSASSFGGRLVATGTSSVSADTVVLTADRLPDGAGSTALFFQGDTQPISPAVFGDGLRCATGTIMRLAIEPVVPGTGNTGSAVYPSAGNALISIQGQVVPGQVRYYQVDYRDAQTYCTSDTFNLTNGVAILWCP